MMKWQYTRLSLLRDYIIGNCISDSDVRGQDIG